MVMTTLSPGNQTPRSPTRASAPNSYLSSSQYTLHYALFPFSLPQSCTVELKLQNRYNHAIYPPPPKTYMDLWVFSGTHLSYISYNSIPLMGVYLNIRSTIPIRGMVYRRQQYLPKATQHSNTIYYVCKIFLEPILTIADFSILKESTR